MANFLKKHIENTQTFEFDLSKRLFDIFFSVFTLIFASPLYLLIALSIKCSSKGAIFYGSTRIGKSGKQFVCWKFRTMFEDAELRLKNILEHDPVLQREWEVFWKLKNDPRVTSVGRLLRKISLDELPQFWNVLKGDLSVVGPRPVTLDEIKKYYGEKAEKILSMRPGITGVWQTSGRNLLAFEDRVLLEESYIDQHSFLFDLKLILKTISTLFFSKGAY